MKILVINTVPFRINGISSNILNYYREFKNNPLLSFDFVINDFIDPLLAEDFEDVKGIFVLSNRKRKTLKWILSLKKILSNEYDIIHIHGNSSLMYLETYMSRKFSPRSKVIVHNHSVRTEFPTINKILKYKFLNSFDLAFAVSEESGNWLFGQNNFEVLKNGISSEKFKFSSKKRKEFRKYYGLNENSKVFLHVGLFNKVKNQEFVLEVFSKLIRNVDDAHLFFVGEGFTEDSLKKVVLEKGISNKVIFVGNRNDVENYYSMSDYFLFPSLFESLGIVLIEAQASGLTCFISETIPKSAIISKKVTQLNLKDGSSVWVNYINQIVNRDGVLNQEQRSKEVTVLKENDFDIKSNAKILFKKYIELCLPKGEDNE